MTSTMKSEPPFGKRGTGRRNLVLSGGTAGTLGAARRGGLRGGFVGGCGERDDGAGTDRSRPETVCAPWWPLLVFVPAP